jgi:hypothetical protein
VRRLTRDQVVAFHRENYRPDGATIAVVGDVTRDGSTRAHGEARLVERTDPPVPHPPACLPPVESSASSATDAGHGLAGAAGIRQDHPDASARGRELHPGRRVGLEALTEGARRGLAYSVPTAPSVPVATAPPTSRDSDTARGRRRGHAWSGGDGTDGARVVTPRELDSAKSYLIGGYPLKTDTSGQMAGLLVAVEERARPGWPDPSRPGFRA